jgi:hypothetical protein
MAAPKATRTRLASTDRELETAFERQGRGAQSIARIVDEQVIDWWTELEAIAHTS